MNTDDYWYKNAILYAVDVDRFRDANGDGVGDFAGLAERLPYLAELGVTALWILPFYPAPDRDNGYDVKNYYDVDPQLGSLDVFVDFVHQAGEHGIRVILDLVMNHTSNEHPWFQASRRDPASRYRRYYTWAEMPSPVPDGQGPVFPGEETTVWTYDEVAGAYYYHRFYHFQPDLEMGNPEVRQEILRVLDFWLSFGVAGFRIDATPHLIGTTEVKESAIRDPHGLLRDLRAYVEQRRAGTVLIGEADVEPDKIAAYFGDADELVLLFNFLLNNYLFLALARESAEPIRRVLQQLPAIPEACQWANFLRNMDEADLERLSEAERQQVFERFAPEERMQIFGRGIRRRLAPMLGGDRKRMELAYSLLFSLPGTPTLVYGDEIGLGEDLTQEGRRAVRVPMQWSAERNAGFSSARKKALVQPVVSEGPFGYEQVNVAAQQGDPDSFLGWMQRLIRVRRGCEEIGYGAWHVLDAGEDGVLVQRSAWKGGTVITVHNLTGAACSVAVEAPLLFDLFREEHVAPEGGQLRLDLEPYGYRWFRVERERGA